MAPRTLKVPGADGSKNCNTDGGLERFRVSFVQKVTCTVPLFFSRQWIDHDLQERVIDFSPCSVQKKSLPALQITNISPGEIR
jgi:hypothetical protein